MIFPFAINPRKRQCPGKRRGPKGEEMRHLTRDEKLTIYDIVREAGMPEVLRLLGTIACSEASTTEAGDKIREVLFRLARTNAKIVK